MLLADFTEGNDTHAGVCRELTIPARVGGPKVFRVKKPPGSPPSVSAINATLLRACPGWNMAFKTDLDNGVSSTFQKGVVFFRFGKRAHQRPFVIGEVACLTGP